METRVLQTGSDPAAPFPPPVHAIETRPLTKRFNGVDALQSLDLVVPTNSPFGFLGPIGAGKTTAIKLLLGPAKPSSGKV